MTTHRHQRNVRVTPEMAKEWLNNARTNRAISKVRVMEWVRKFAAGRATTEGVAPILICGVKGRDGVCGGQHRLTGIVEYGQPVTLPVLFGATEVDIENQNDQRPNRAGDIAQILGLRCAEGVKIANTTNAAFQQIAYQENSTTVRTSDSVTWNAGIDGLGEDNIRVVTSRTGNRLTAAGKAALIYARPLNPSLVDHIMDDMLSPAPVSGIPTAINTLAARIKKEKTKPWAATAMYFRALRAYFSGELSLSKIETPSGKKDFEYFRRLRQDAGLAVDIFPI